MEEIESLTLEMRMRRARGDSISDIRDVLRRGGVSPEAARKVLLEVDTDAPRMSSKYDFKEEWGETKQRIERRDRGQRREYGLDLGFRPVIIGIIIVNIAVFAYMLSLPRSELGWFVYEYGFVPDVFPGNAHALVTSMFIHGGLEHIFFNMLFLYLLGCMVEKRLGKARFLLFYLASGVLAGLIYVASASSFGVPGNIPAVGASGAIFGVLAGGVLYKPLARMPIILIPVIGQVVLFISFWGIFGNPSLLKFPFRGVIPYAVVGLSYLIFWLFIAGIGLLGDVAENAHIGGFIAGFFLFTALDRWGRHRSPEG